MGKYRCLRSRLPAKTQDSLEFPATWQGSAIDKNREITCKNRENQTKYQGWFVSVELVHCRIASSERDLFSLSMCKLFHPLVPA